MAARLFACGPNFPNYLLAEGDAAVLVAPEANFAQEVTRMKLVSSRFQAVEATGSYVAEAVAAESADLRAALKRAGVAGDEAETIRRAHAATREKLRQFIAGTEAQENPRPWVWDENGGHYTEPPASPPAFPKIEIPSGLPEEFSDYLEGAIAWHNPAVADKSVARQAWERLLERPPAERHFKSTWAAFMLGRAWEKEDPDKAVEYFKQVRELARGKFADSVGLAAASLGLEARVDLHRKNYEQAIELYLEQLATGDSTAMNSLRFTAAKALAGGAAVLEPLAKNPRTQRLITAYIISQRFPDPASHESDSSEGAQAQPEEAAPQPNAEAKAHPENPARIWLKAVEAAGIKDVESAEQLALAAYRLNEMDLAQRWIQRAPSSPVAQWLQAKLLLRAGKVQATAALLARVVQHFPIEPRCTNEVAAVAFKDSLFVDVGSYYTDYIPAGRHAWGELGVLHLARREYTQALDALLNAGFWMDAAYIAERVLTLDELKAYVNRQWPPVSAQQVADEKATYGDDQVSPALLRERIRYLLARRLTRAIRHDEAREYYPAEWVSQFDALVQALRNGWNESLPADQRARALFEAAYITRTNGMELLGTEAEPDWHVHLGDYDQGVWVVERATNAAAKILTAGQDELRRASQHTADPEVRFHYRYQAAFIAWEAAKLLPDNSDETARVLWTAGTWLKSRDPKTADIFYKALVRRNRKTALGAEADRRRWFPELDENGKVIPREPEPPAATSTPSESDPSLNEMTSAGDSSAPVPDANAEPPSTDPNQPEAMNAPDPSESADSPPAQEQGYEYVVRSGDSLASIARACTEAGINLTPRDIANANNLGTDRIKVGQRLFIPAPKQ